MKEETLKVIDITSAPTDRCIHRFLCLDGVPLTLVALHSSVRIYNSTSVHKIGAIRYIHKVVCLFEIAS